MRNDSLNFDHLISHRFRGFSKHENTLDGLRAALDFSVLNLEFDIRIAACGTPMIYHDEFAPDADGVMRNLCDYKASSFLKLGGTFARISSFEQLLELVKAHPNKEARLLIDIKDAGFETEIHSLLSLYRLQHRTVYVSWLPEVLYKLQDFAPDIPKCLSHWSKPVNATIRAVHKVFQSGDGNIRPTDPGYIMGIRSGWEVTSGLKGQMLEMLKRSGGGVCVPQDMVTKDLCDYYHKHSLFVSTFSYLNVPAIKSHQTAMGIDMYFIDNKTVFEELA